MTTPHYLTCIQLPNFPNRNELEPLENWLRSLSEECRDDPNVSDVHVLLALKWPAADILNTVTACTSLS